jgi:hypothetical protein
MWFIVSYLIWESLLEPFWRCVLDTLGHCRLADCVGLALAVLVDGHPCGLGDEACLLESRASDATELEGEGHSGNYVG